MELEQLTKVELIEKRDIARVKHDKEMVEKIELILNTLNEQDSPLPFNYGKAYYFWMLLPSFVFIPLLIDIILSLIGVDLGFVRETIGPTKLGSIGTKISINFLAVWYISIPVYLFITYKRVRDIGLNIWVFVLFVIPSLNLTLIFWPSKKI